MTAPAKPAPPKEPPKPKAIVVHLPGFRVTCRVCRHTSPPLTGNARAVEVVTGCTCWNPEPALVLTFPNADHIIPIEPFAGDGQG